jgi:cytochrome c biogenesis protein CcmG/thiol:disulfide interchange protein DsbE
VRALLAALVLASGSLEPPEALLVQSFPQPAPAPMLALTDPHGRQVTLDEFRGRFVILNFWATWCLPCRAEMPAMQRLYLAYRDRGLVVVGVNFKESTRQVQDFMLEQALTFPALLDRDGNAATALRVIGLPMTFLLDRERRILWRAIGEREWDTSATRAYLDQLLAS